jgi:hypothetical protein
MKKHFLLVALFLASFSYGYSQTIRNLIGTWHNQLNSTLRITSIKPNTNQLAGTYMLSNGQVFNLIGWANDLPPAANHVVAVAFSVQFGPAYGSITSWTGTFTNTNGVLTISTIWNLVSPNAAQSFSHITTNFDVFTPGPAKKTSK